MSNIIAIDTSTEACSVALNIDGDVTEAYEVLPRQHAATVLPMVRALMDVQGFGLSSLDAVAFGRGPGSFTGLRIAAGVAQGLAFGLDVPVLPVSTLAALALQGYRRHGEDNLLAALDARIGELYWGRFHVENKGGETRVHALQEERLSAPGEVDFVESGSPLSWYGVGNGWAFREQMHEASWLARLKGYDASLLPRAGAMVELAAQDYRAGHLLPPEQAAPVYLRDKVTHSRD